MLKNLLNRICFAFRVTSFTEGTILSWSKSWKNWISKGRDCFRRFHLLSIRHWSWNHSQEQWKKFRYKKTLQDLVQLEIHIEKDSHDFHTKCYRRGIMWYLRGGSLRIRVRRIWRTCWATYRTLRQVILMLK